MEHETEHDLARSEGSYFARSSGHDRELERLGLLEEMCDPATIRRLERIGVREGWSCLEVAAGRGSIAAWLGDRVGSRGQVLAVDINTRFLGHLSAPVEVKTVNLLTDDLGSGVFDVVHARAILMHLRDPEPALKRMAAAVRPGGWLLIEEGDYEGVAGLAGHPEADLFTEDLRSIFLRYKQAGVADPFFGRQVRQLVEGAGFQNVIGEGVTEIWRGGEVGARFVDLSCSIFHDSGLATDEEYGRDVRLLRDSSFVFKDKIFYGAWGRRPS